MGIYLDIDISFLENEIVDDFFFFDDLEDLDSDVENDFFEDIISIVLIFKLLLRYFQNVWNSQDFF